VKLSVGWPQNFTKKSKSIQKLGAGGGGGTEAYRQYGDHTTLLSFLMKINKAENGTRKSKNINNIRQQE
jgi:hypothetical protein